MEWLSELIPLATGVILAVVGYLLHQRHEAGKLRAETHAVTSKTPAEVESLSITTMEKVIDSLRSEVDRQAARIRHLEEREQVLLTERDELRKRVDELSSSVAAMGAELDAIRARLAPTTD